MAIATLDSIVAAMPGYALPINKVTATSKAAGTFHSLFKVAGYPGAGSSPAAFGSNGTQYTQGNGGLSWANPGSGNTYLARYSASSSTVGTIVLYDRIWACSGMSGTSGSAQTIPSFPALARYTTGEYLEMYVEWYSATGGTAATFTVSYTAQLSAGAGTSPSTTIQATPAVGQMQPIPLQAGHYGVKSITSLTLSGTTGTAGDFGITLLKRIAEIPVTSANIAGVQDAIALGFPQIVNDSCLCFMVMCSTTNTGQIIGSVNLIQG